MSNGGLTDKGKKMQTSGKTVLSIILSAFMGGAIVFGALFAGMFFYTLHVPYGAPANPEAMGQAIGVMFIAFLVIILPFKWVIYRKLGYGINLVLFFGIPTLVFFFFFEIGPFLSFLIYWAVGSLVFYQFLAAKHQPVKQKSTTPPRYQWPS